MVNIPFIEFKHVSKIFRDKIILHDISMEIPFGSIFGIIGKSGTGKTTLLNILIGFFKPQKGVILFQARNIRDDLNGVQQQFGFASQEVSFYHKLTVKENLEYFGKLYNMDDKEIDKLIPALLKLVELDEQEDTISSELSSGMKKRLDIACALVHSPKVLILDEPTEDLDPMLRKGMYNLLKRINKDMKVTVIITSHLLDEMEHICSRIAILDNRSILAVGSVNELKDMYSKSYEVHLETVSGNYDSIAREVKQHKYVKHVKIAGHKLVVYTSKAEKTLKMLLRLIDIKNEELMDVDVNRPSLGEVFESLTLRNAQATGNNKKEL